MSSTLKQQYADKKLERLQERVLIRDKEILVETATTKLLLEAMNDDDLKRASQVIDKLRGLKGKGIGSLDSAIDKAIGDLNKFTGGGPLTKAWTSLKGKVGFNNPLVKVMTFANALEVGLKQVPMILKNNIGTITPDMKEKSILDVVGTDDDTKKTITQNLLKALSPKGIFGAFKKVPYVDNMQILTQDLLTAPMDGLNAVVKQVGSGPQTDSIAADLKDTATGNGDGAETKGTTPSNPTKSSEPSASTSPSKNTTTTTTSTSSSETPSRPADIRTKVANVAKEKLDSLGVKDAQKVIDALADLNLLKAPS